MSTFSCDFIFQKGDLFLTTDFVHTRDPRRAAYWQSPEHIVSFRLKEGLPLDWEVVLLFGRNDGTARVLAFEETYSLDKLMAPVKDWTILPTYTP